jgi:hypothetical protein
MLGWLQKKVRRIGVAYIAAGSSAAGGRERHEAV